MKEIQVGKNEAGQRFDKLLFKYLNQAPKSFVYKMLRKKNITLNGKKATGNEKLKELDIIKIFLADDTYNKFSSHEEKEYPTTKLDIIYEDENVLFINKPVGMLSQKAKETDVSLNEYVIGYLIESNAISKESLESFKPSVCNRLDRNTSGLIVAGKSLIGLQTMSQMFKERTMDKYYLCVVAGTLKENKEIDGYLYKNTQTNKVAINHDKKGDYIRTSYIPLHTSDEITLLKVKLITGRTHQIRAHLASIGHPIIGDYKYGNKKINEQFRKLFGIKSQLLHSYILKFGQVDGSLSYLSNKEYKANTPEIFHTISKEFI